jgi:hypothetical protein
MDTTAFGKIGDAIADYAPGIAGVLAATGVGAPVAAGVAALGSIAKIFGLGSDATPEQVHAAIVADPKSAIKLRLAEMDFAINNRKLDIEEIKTQMAPYLEGLQTKTIPWVDALHKMGRQILTVLNIIAVVVLMLYGKSITPQVALVLGGSNIAYQLIKGKGNPTA